MPRPLSVSLGEHARAAEAGRVVDLDRVDVVLLGHRRGRQRGRQRRGDDLAREHDRQRQVELADAAAAAVDEQRALDRAEARCSGVGSVGVVEPVSSAGIVAADDDAVAAEAQADARVTPAAVEWTTTRSSPSSVSSSISSRPT